MFDFISKLTYKKHVCRIFGCLAIVVMDMSALHNEPNIDFYYSNFRLCWLIWEVHIDFVQVVVDDVLLIRIIFTNRHAF